MAEIKDAVTAHESDNNCKKKNINYYSKGQTVPSRTDQIRNQTLKNINLLSVKNKHLYIITYMQI